MGYAAYREGACRGNSAGPHSRPGCLTSCIWEEAAPHHKTSLRATEVPLWNCNGLYWKPSFDWCEVWDPSKARIQAATKTKEGRWPRVGPSCLPAGVCFRKSSLTGHGSGKYPAVRRICNPLLSQSTKKKLTFKEMMEKLVIFFLWHRSSVYFRLQGNCGPVCCPLWNHF